MSDLTMYKPQNNGPHTTLAAVINASQTSITVEDSSVLPPDLPNVLTIGTEEDAELVKVTSISGNILAVERGYNNTTAKQWDAGVWIYRAITAQDIEALQGRVNNVVLTLGKEEFKELTEAEGAALFAKGVRIIVADGIGYALSETGELKEINKMNQDVLKRLETVEKTTGALVEGVEIVPEVTGAVITVNDASNRPLRGLTIYGKSTQNGTPSPTNPVEIVSVESAKTTVCGKNIIDLSRLVEPNASTLMLSDIGNGQLKVTTSSPPPSSALATIAKINMIAGKTYRISGGTDSAQLTLRNKSGGGVYANDDGKGAQYTPEVNTEGHLKVRVGAGETADLVMTPMMTIENSNKTFSPFVGKYLSIQGPLNGIPVSSGGNYTDANGQQWVCDVIHAERKTLEKRIGDIPSYAGEDVGSVWMSSSGTLTTGAHVIYALPNPTERLITDDEFDSDAFRALTTNKPNTTIYNDAGADMTVRYVADNQLYIDKKIAEATAANSAAMAALMEGLNDV